MMRERGEERNCGAPQHGEHGYGDEGNAGGVPMVCALSLQVLR